jgi:hypothetical protein
MKHRVAVLFVIYGIGLLACAGWAGMYVTWPTVEPDKGIAAWLIREYVDSDARFVFIEEGAKVEEGIAFDIPGSEYIRDHKRCASEAIIEIHGITDPKAVALAELARKLEIGRWYAEYNDAEQPLAEALTEIWQERGDSTNRLERALKRLDAWQPSIDD